MVYSKSIVWILVISCYWIGGVVVHQHVQRYFSYLSHQWGFDVLQERVAWCWVILGVMGVGLLVAQAFQQKKDRSLFQWGIWALSTVMLLICWNLLSQTRAESIHFVQYAVLLLMLFKVYPKRWRAFGFTVLLGIIDEGWQAYVTTGVLDWVDILFNVLGGWIGWLLVWEWKGEAIKPAEKREDCR